MTGEDKILIHSAMENLANSSLKAAEALNQVAKKANELAKEIEKNDLFEKWLESLDIPLTAWQKEMLRLMCTNHNKELYISMPRHYGRYMVLKLVEQYKQMIKGERKEMSNKMKNFDMKDVHSGYVVQFRDGTYALCMRVGEKFTKIFARTGFKTLGVTDLKEGTHFFYTSSYKGECHYVYDPICSRTKPDPAFDIVKVYGLIHGVNNYLMVGDITITNRPLLWEEDVKEMTLEEIEHKLGHKVKIVEPEKPVGIKGKDCERCVYRMGGSKCGSITPYSDVRGECEACKQSLGLKNCPCSYKYANDGEPCPHFEEERE